MNDEAVISDEDLVLYYYDDGLSAPAKKVISDAVGSDGALARRYARLSAELDALPDPEPLPPSAATVERWHSGFDAISAPRRGTVRLRRHLPLYAAGVAVAAALAIGIGIGALLGGGTPPGSVGRTAPEVTAFTDYTAGSRSRFLRSLEVHFRDSRASLKALEQDSADSRRLRLARLIDDNRLHQRAARQSDADRFARVLRAFNLVLSELAAEDLSAEEVEALRTRLLFELDVMLTKLSREPSEGQDII